MTLTVGGSEEKVISKKESPIHKDDVPSKERQENLDDGSVLVLILHGETRPSDKNVKNLQWLFSDPYFIVQNCAVEIPHTIPSVKEQDREQYVENYRMMKAITYALEGPYINDNGEIKSQGYWAGLPVIIIKDSSVSNLVPSNDQPIGGMKERIKTALARAPSANLFFLCKWGDSCDKYFDVDSPSDSMNSGSRNSDLKWTTSPTATQAIMYSHPSLEIVKDALSKSKVPMGTLLNSMISQEKLKAVAFVPNIINYDINFALSSDDYAKTAECSTAKSSDTSSFNAAMVVWILIVLIVLILIIWCIVKFLF